METLDFGKYELMVILNPDLGDKDSGKKVQEIKDMLTAQKAKVTKEDIWGIRDLAYRIKGKDLGFYLVLNFEAPSEMLIELEKTLRLDPAVLRLLIVALPEDYQLKTLREYEEEEEKSLEKRRLKAEGKGEKPLMMDEPKVEMKKVPKVQKQNLEEVEAKLKNIIENPDIAV